eukprot:2588462-Amphidinium_carterae.2
MALLGMKAPMQEGCPTRRPGGCRILLRAGDTAFLSLTHGLKCSIESFPMPFRSRRAVRQCLARTRQ